MLARRIIPCLDVKDGRVVKGTNFEGLRDMADPVEMARFYNESGADELVFYDITASAEGRNLFTDILRRVAGEIFIPLTVGGGIRTLEDFDRVLKCGADKVSVNSGAIADPAIIGAAAKKYGDQCVVLSMDVKDGRVVKGVNFLGLADVSSPVKLAKFYSDCGADELVFYDITASAEGRALFTDILTEVASTIFIPLTVGGGINTVEDFDRVLKCGADKVSVNSGAIRDPSLISRAAQKYGDQCVVLSVDAKRVDGQFRVFAKGGREDTGIDAMEWAARGVADGAGEIVLNSIDTDGVKQGFDLEMLDALASRVSVPIIASGGAGKMEDFAQLFTHPGIDAGLAASIFHTRQVDIKELKHYLRAQGVEMRI